jgi:acylphosphatase
VQGVFPLLYSQTGSESDYRGLVRNSPKGNVEAFAQGDKTNLELFIEIQQQGPSFYRVDEMKLIWEHAERDYSDFPLSNKCN